MCLLREPGTTPSWSTAEGINDWIPPTDVPVEMTCWKGDPFARASPERIAAQWVLDEFKRRVNARRPRGSRFAPPDTRVSAIAADRGRLERRLLDHLSAQAAARERFAMDLGLSDADIAPYQGHPHVTVRPPAGEDIRFTVEWRRESPLVLFATDGQDDGWIGRSIREVLADPTAVAYDGLVDELERWLGSPIASQSARRPSSFAWSL